MVQNASMRVVRPAGEEREDEMLVPQSDQQRQVTGSGVSGVQIPGHDAGIRDQGIRNEERLLPDYLFTYLLYGLRYSAKKSAMAL
jgi:hypothetical protein